MNFLTQDDKSGRYDEIQCGLAATQYESLPMPPHTVWEFLEGYGAMQANAEKVHGEWAGARAEVEERLNEMITAEELEQMLIDTREMAKSPAKLVFAMNDGWGALELHRRKAFSTDLMSSHLDFGSMNAEQDDWLRLLNDGTIGVHDPKTVPPSYQSQKEWLDMLKSAILNKDKDNWYAYYLLGTASSASENYSLAEEYLKKSLSLCESAWANYALAVVYKKTGVKEKETEFMLKAYSLRPDDISLMKEVFRTLHENGEDEKIISFYENGSSELKDNKRCLLYYAYALARTGKYLQAEEILCGKDGKTYLVVPDVRECELNVTQLWVYIQSCKGMTREQMGEPPYDLDFRMFSAREGWF